MYYASAFYWIVAGLWAYTRSPNDELGRRYPFISLVLSMTIGGFMLPVAILSRIVK